MLLSKMLKNLGIDDVDLEDDVEVVVVDGEGVRYFINGIVLPEEDGDEDAILIQIN